MISPGLRPSTNANSYAGSQIGSLVFTAENGSVNAAVTTAAKVGCSFIVGHK